MQETRHQNLFLRDPRKILSFVSLITGEHSCAVAITAERHTLVSLTVKYSGVFGIKIQNVEECRGYQVKRP